MLGDLGADVVKIEPPRGDETRDWGPSTDGRSAAFIAVNRNKRSMVLDLSTQEARDVLHHLVLSADVLVENFRTGTMERWGLGWERLHADNPRLIYASVSAFGRTGGMADDPGYEAVVQAFAGVMSITGEPGGPPVRSGPSLLDLGTGIVAAQAVMAALLHREKTGYGQLVETALLSTAMTMLAYQVQGFFTDGTVPARLGSGHPSLLPYRVYRCGDGNDVFIAAGNDGLFTRFCAALDLSSLAHDRRFSTLEARRTHRAELDAVIERHLQGLTCDDVMRRLGDAGVPSAEVNSIDVAAQHPQVRSARALRTVLDHATGHDVEVVSSPFVASEMDTDPVRAAPRLGEHTIEVLEQAGVQSLLIRDFHSRGAKA
jgi:crotonobetainyl-CoA:carnitine CoA-transferase CaiB-like acyl-CoA transferase